MADSRGLQRRYRPFGLPFLDTLRQWLPSFLPFQLEFQLESHFNLNQKMKGVETNRPHRDRILLDKLGSRMGLKDPMDWYKVTTELLLQEAGTHSLNSFRTLLRKHRNSPEKLFKTAYPEHKWNGDSFQKFPVSVLSDRNSQRAFLDRVGKQIGVKTMYDWYHMTEREVRRGGASELLRIYGEDLSLLLERVYPGHEWDREKLGTDVSVLDRKMLDEIGRKVGVEGLDEWYGVTTDCFKRNGGALLLSRYGGHLCDVVSKLHPERDWKLDRFKRVGKRSFGELVRPLEDMDLETLSEFLEWMSKELKIKGLEDWYRVSLHQVRQVVPLGIFQGKPLAKALQEVYPEYNWDVAKLQVRRSTIKASQRMLAAVVHEIFPLSGERGALSDSLQQN